MSEPHYITVMSREFYRKNLLLLPTSRLHFHFSVFSTLKANLTANNINFPIILFLKELETESETFADKLISLHVFRLRVVVTFPPRTKYIYA